MERTKDTYREIVTAEFEREHFENLCRINNLKLDVDYTLKKVNVPDYPYQKDEKWLQQKRKADKEYKELKRIEFEIRN